MARISGYRLMWLLVMFDLPTDDSAARKRYRVFRNTLLENGFEMLQYSVYARPSPSEEAAAAKTSKIRRCLPADGEVRLLTLTDKQFGRMQVFYGKLRRPTETAPEQLEFF